MALFGNPWIALRTEGGSRVDHIDRIQASFKTQGIKTKVTDVGNGLRRIHVRKKDLERAKELLDLFDQENK